MKNPEYIEQIYAVVFFFLGFAFIVFGVLSLLTILKPTSHSLVQDSRMIGAGFIMLGIAFLIVQRIFIRLASNKNQLRRELSSNGTKVIGKVEKVYMSKQIKGWGKFPYRVLYTYNYQGKVYRGKSCLLWEKPDVKETDSIEVYVNDAGESTIQL